MNLVESVAKASDYLERHGVVSPRTNAERLLGCVIGMDRLGIYTNSDRLLSAWEAEHYKLLLSRRAKGHPLQYITKEAGFFGLTFEVRPGVFIPRPETEVLVEKALGILEQLEAPRVLDLGTGCGNIAVCIAAGSRSSVVATDIDWLPLELCARNARQNRASERIEVIQGDLYGAVEGVSSRVFDMVVSNPPYVPVSGWEDLPVEVRDYEPLEALLGGPDGLHYLKRIIQGAPSHLRGGGWLALEVDESHAAEVTDRLLKDDLWDRRRLENDLAGRPRVVTARLRESGRD